MALTYSVSAVVSGDHYLVSVEVKEGNTVVQTGSIDVGAADETTAKKYGEDVFIRDLRTNNVKQIGALVLPVDSEVISDGGTTAEA